MSSTPYDDVFRTLLTDCTELMIPVVNEIFHTDYTGNEKIRLLQNEHFIQMPDGSKQERITDSSFEIMSGNTCNIKCKKRYHIECQSFEDVIVELHTDTGAVGYGEAPPTGVITGDTTGAIIGAIRDHIAPAILGRNLDEFEDLTAAVQKALVHNTSAKAAVDMALWDLLGQKYSAPVYRMLGGARSNIVTDITISVNPPEEMARDARTAIQRGYDCLKVKVGIDPELDVARLAAVREAVGKDVKLRIDANQAWNAKQAVRILDQMQEKGLDIEFVEQPVPAADLEGMQYVTRHASVPVLADESVFSPADALRIMQTGAADFVNIKLMKCGGITNALRIASAAEVYGVECMIGCMLEAKISVNAAVELACAKKIITKVDLDGPVLCSEDHILGGAVFDEKNITVSDAPGMGIQGFVPGKVTYLDD